MEAVTNTNYSTFERFVEKQSTTGNLHTHITKVMSHLVRHTHPSDSLNQLEEVSYLMKHPEKAEDFLRTVQSRDYAKPGDQARKEATEKQIAQAREYFTFVKETDPDPETGAKERVVPAPIGFLPDLRADSKIYEWAGIGFDEFEVHNLQKSLQKHITACGATEMRLWGKIRGSEKDYYVAEGSLAAAEGDPSQEGLEEGRGSGVNKMAYWVSNGPMSEWTQLPDLKP